MDVIDRKAVLEALDELDSHQTMSRYQCSKDLANTRLGISMAFDVVDAMPTVDAVPVVRCKDCVRSEQVNDLPKHCECILNGDIHEETYYCADGKRKEGE